MVAVQTVHAALLPPSTARRRSRASPGRLPRRSPIRARGGSRSSSGQGAEASETSSPRGREDWRVQEALARVVEIQVLKVRIANFLDDCSENLLWLAEGADAELEGAAGEEVKILGPPLKLGHFNGAQTENWMNLIDLGIDEGDGEEAKDEDVPDVLVAKESGRYRTRRNVYLGLMGLIWAGLMQNTVFAVPYVELDKFAALCLVFLALVVQVCYEEETDHESYES